MTVQTKRHIDSTPDGSNELFQTPDTFLADTLWVTEAGGSNGDTLRQPNEMGGGFYQLSPAPEAGTKLYLTYDIEVVDETVNSGLTPWEHDQMNKLLLAIQAQQEAINNIDEAMGNRVTHKDWNTWSSVVERELADVKSAIKE